MKYLQNNNIKNEVIEKLIDKLEEYEGITEYSCDLAYKLYEGENIDGVYFYNNHKATEWIKNNWDNLPEILEELKANFDGDFISKLCLDMFDNPDRFVVVIMIEVASYLMGQCEFIENNWNDKIELTKENIKIITEQLENLKD